MNTMKRMLRIQDISRGSRLVCIFFMAIVFIFLLGLSYSLWTENGYCLVTDDLFNYRLVWFFEGDESEASNVLFGYFSVFAKIMFTFSIILIYGLIIMGFYHLQRLLYYYAKGMIFTTEANSQIRQIGVIVSLAGLVFTTGDQLMKNAIYLALNGNALGLRLHFPDYILVIIIPLLVGATIMCISWVMETGREMREDQEFTI